MYQRFLIVIRRSPNMQAHSSRYAHYIIAASGYDTLYGHFASLRAGIMSDDMIPYIPAIPDKHAKKDMRVSFRLKLVHWSNPLPAA